MHTIVLDAKVFVSALRSGGGASRQVLRRILLGQVLAALARAGLWVNVYYGWRPNFRDESDNHLIELAIAGNAHAVVTHNVRDLTRGELAWPQLRVMTPHQFLKEQP